MQQQHGMCVPGAGGRANCAALYRNRQMSPAPHTSLSLLRLASADAFTPISVNTPARLMDAKEFRERGKQVIDEIADYYEALGTVPPMAKVEPGYLYRLISHEVPETPEPLEAIQRDIRDKIMPGMTHWQSPNFFAWYPCNASFPAMLGDMYSAMFSIVEFNWLCSPAATELETVVMDALARLIGLDKRFMAIKEDGTEGSGGGVIQGSASEATMVAMIAAREMAIDRLKARDLDEEEAGRLRGKLIAYCSDQTHSSIQKAANVIGCKINVLPTRTTSFRLTEDMLRDAVAKDRAAGLVPFFVCATFGTTNTASIDDIPGIASVSELEHLWLHVDAAYAGAALPCPEFRPLARGIERADSFSFNPHKWMLSNHSCCAMWVADSTHLVNALSINREYLPKVKNGTGFVKDYRDWQLPLGRPFRAMKLWFILRMYGAQGIRKHIRDDVEQAKWLGKQLEDDGRFELVVPVVFGLAVFRIKPSAVAGAGATDSANKANVDLVNAINSNGRVFLLGTKLHGVDAIRVAIGSTYGTQDHVSALCEEIKETATNILQHCE
ncbi:hypothetical protein GQ54DRAFT_299457 [Martensiomyces pterosporus]|nr:hypothetical protein GQ54DRAFT_299457 [Martensiomyces pterosporus]